jgi:hypothetical protein
MEAVTGTLQAEHKHSEEYRLIRELEELSEGAMQRRLILELDDAYFFSRLERGDVKTFVNLLLRNLAE